MGWINQLLMTLVGLWLTRFLLEQLGESDYGIWLVITQIIAYLMLLDLGVVAILPRSVAFATGGGRFEDVREEIGKSIYLVLLELPIVVAVSATAALLIPSSWAHATGPVGLVLIAFVVFFPLRVYEAALQGMQDLTAVSVIRLLTWASGVITTVVCVVFGLQLWSLAIGWVASQLTTTLASALRLYLFSRKSFTIRPRIMRGGELRDHARRSLWVSISQIANALTAGTDMIIIGRFLGAEAVVPYFCTYKILSVLQHQPNMILQSAAPALSELRVSESPARLRFATGGLTQGVMILSGLIACGVLALNESFVGWWVGPEYFGGTMLTVILVLTALIRHWSNTALFANFAFGHDKHNSLVTLADGIVTVVMGVALTGGLGIVGVAVGSLCGATVVALPANLRKLARTLGGSFTDSVMTPLTPWFIRGVPLMIAAGFIGSSLSLDTVFMIVVVGLLITGIYAAAMFGLTKREPLHAYISQFTGAFR